MVFEPYILSPGSVLQTGEITHQSLNLIFIFLDFQEK